MRPPIRRLRLHPPAVRRAADLTSRSSTGGASPALARVVRDELGAFLDREDYAASRVAADAGGRCALADNPGAWERWRRALGGEVPRSSGRAARGRGAASACGMDCAARRARGAGGGGAPATPSGSRGGASLAPARGGRGLRSAGEHGAPRRASRTRSILISRASPRATTACRRRPSNVADRAPRTGGGW